jgi:HD-GYP domain-containing protein (c-di-GMP phosphodiesterase class II)
LAARAPTAMGQGGATATQVPRAHPRGVAVWGAPAATAMGLGGATATHVRRAGLLHDLGRLGVSNAVWDKTAELSAAELRYGYDCTRT